VPFGALERGVDSDHGAPGMQPQNVGDGVAKGINQVNLNYIGWPLNNEKIQVGGINSCPYCF